MQYVDGKIPHEIHTEVHAVLCVVVWNNRLVGYVMLCSMDGGWIMDHGWYVPYYCATTTPLLTLTFDYFTFWFRPSPLFLIRTTSPCSFFVDYITSTYGTI